MITPTQRHHYYYFNDIQTRWMDNDIYGHINNVHYYSYFDTVTNNYLIEQAGLNISTSPVVGFIVASRCQYLSPIVHPTVINAAFRVNKLGNSSVEYGLAIFKQGEEHASAWGTYTHVFVNRETNQSVSIPQQIREVLQKAIIDID